MLKLVFVVLCCEMDLLPPPDFCWKGSVAPLCSGELPSTAPAGPCSLATH